MNMKCGPTVLLLVKKLLVTLDYIPSPIGLSLPGSGMCTKKTLNKPHNLKSVKNYMQFDDCEIKIRRTEQKVFFVARL